MFIAHRRSFSDSDSDGVLLIFYIILSFASDNRQKAINISTWDWTVLIDTKSRIEVIN